jgi:dTDP-4-amino-4,6-dideoxygalactose transaminase
VSLRRQPPVYSPLTLGSLGAAAASLVGHDRTIRQALEQQLRDRFGVAGVLLTDSGTSALALALRAATGSSSRPVALPAYGCYDLATAADVARATVLLYDVDPVTLNPDLDSVRRALEAGAGSVVVASLFGYPIALEPLLTSATGAGATVIEDAAQAVGMSWRGRVAGSSAPFGVLSFGRGKGVTGGGGGALLLRDAGSIAALGQVQAGELPPVSSLKPVIALTAQWALARPICYGALAALPLGLGETHYLPPSEPRGAARVSAGAVRHTLTLEGPERAGRQRRTARLLAAASNSARWSTVTPVPEGISSCLRFPLVANQPAAIDLKRAARLGILPSYPLALCDLPGFAERVINRGDPFPGARRLASHLLTLPTHSLLTEADLGRLEEWLAEPA